jgi:hypothetical protein
VVNVDTLIQNMRLGLLQMDLEGARQRDPEGFQFYAAGVHSAINHIIAAQRRS